MPSVWWVCDDVPTKILPVRTHGENRPCHGECLRSCTKSLFSALNWPSKIFQYFTVPVSLVANCHLAVISQQAKCRLVVSPSCRGYSCRQIMFAWVFVTWAQSDDASRVTVVFAQVSSGMPRFLSPYATPILRRTFNIGTFPLESCGWCFWKYQKPTCMKYTQWSSDLSRSGGAPFRIDGKPRLSKEPVHDSVSAEKATPTTVLPTTVCIISLWPQKIGDLFWKCPLV